MGQNFRKRYLKWKKKKKKTLHAIQYDPTDSPLLCSFILPILLLYHRAKKRTSISPNSAEWTEILDGVRSSPDWLYILHFIAIALSELDIYQKLILIEAYQKITDEGRLGGLAG